MLKSSLSQIGSIVYSVGAMQKLTKVGANLNPRGLPSTGPVALPLLHSVAPS